VAGQCGAAGDFGGFQVADLADHDDVRILAQHRAESAGVGAAGAVVDVDLVDALDIHLDGILDGDDVHLVRVEVREGRVERGSLTGAGRAGDEDHSLLGAQQPLEVLERVRVQAQATDLLKLALPPKKAENHDLAEVAGKGGGTQLQVFPLDRHHAAAVLGLARLRRVHAAEDLHPGHHAGKQLTDQRRDVAHAAIDAVADSDTLRSRLHVDVAGPAPGRIHDDGVDDGDRGSLRIFGDGFGERHLGDSDWGLNLLWHWAASA
jgi:hypothetical protein